MRLLLALLLTLDLSQVLAQNRSQQQQALNCHVCERENNFMCKNNVKCAPSEKFCLTTAIKIFPRFFLTTKQCSNLCPLIEVKEKPPPPKPFLLVKTHPLPFFYVKCCRVSLCNEPAPNLSVDLFREHTGHAAEKRCSHTLLGPLASMAAFAGPRLP